MQPAPQDTVDVRAKESQHLDDVGSTTLNESDPTATPILEGNVVQVQPMIVPGVLVPDMIIRPMVADVLIGQRVMWPFPMCCSCLTHCCDDFGLCMYASCCPTCLGAEIGEYIGASGCCGTTSCCCQWWSALAVTILVMSVGSLCCFVGSLAAPWVTSVWLTFGRDALKAKHRLPHDELCCECTISSFFPYFLDCTVCALYQEAYYIKHANLAGNHDFSCCCYTTFCNCKPPGSAPQFA